MMLSVADVILERVERLAGITACPPTLTRRIFSPEQLQAESLIQSWMEEAGLAVRRDPAGNLIGRIEGSTPGGPAIVIGGHIDTDENACRFAGVLSILIGIACVDHFVREGTKLRLAVEVIAFVHDLANRFSAFGHGSRVMLGQLTPEMLSNHDPVDPSDITLRQAMQAQGLDLEHVEDAKRDPSSVAAFLNILAEPGPVLERADTPIGIVDALMTGDVRIFTLKGVVGMAATLPMAGRRDALAGAAECIIKAERLGSSQNDVTATVGRCYVKSVRPYAVPLSVRFSVMFASRDDKARRAAMAEAELSFRDIASRRGLEILVERGLEPDTRRCDPVVVRSFEMAAQASGHRVTIMGTENMQASQFAGIGPIGLLLIRARGGTGWGPGAEVRAEDIAAGLTIFSLASLNLAGGELSAHGEVRASFSYYEDNERIANR